MPTTVIQLGGLGQPQNATETIGGNYTVEVGALSPNPTITFTGQQAFSVNGVADAAGAVTIRAINGAAVTINALGSVAQTTNLIVDGTSSIALGSGIGADNVINAAFSGTGGTLAFDPSLLTALTTPPSVSNFAAGDHITFDTAFTTGDQAVYNPANGDLQLEDNNGNVIGAVHLVGNFATTDFGVGIGAGGQAELDFACFLRGTLIRTPAGDVAVEELGAGDFVTTANGAAVPIVAVRRRSFDGASDDRAVTHPIRIRAGALGPDLPVRDLFVSPDHAMHLDGVLIPATLLQNAISVTQPQHAGPIEYFHIEVDPHAILIAEGAETESYLDIGNRNHFARPGGVTLLPTIDPKTWEDAAAPLVLAGPRLEAVRARLLARIAGEAGARNAPFGRVA